MESENPICPVCTLYLRPGITLKSHLASHPKQKVIDALLRVYVEKEADVPNETPSTTETVPSKQNGSSSSQIWQPNSIVPSNFSGMQGNHSFIYQQFMSTSTQQPSVISMNPLNPQLVTMIGPPFLYQQQQVIMSGGQSAQSGISKPLPIELPVPIVEKVPRNDDVDDDHIEQPELILIETDGSVLLNHQEQETPASLPCSPTPLTIENIRKHDDVEDVVTQTELDENCDHKISEDENWGSPKSSCNSDYHLRVRKDLSKACQTQQESPPPITLEEHGNSYFITEPVTTAPPAFNENESVYTIANSTIVQPSDQVNVINMDGMQLVLCNDFMNTQRISQVDDFDYLSNRSERRVLMDISSVDCSRNGFTEQVDESANVSIRADEHMPARGELSGAESNGAASDIATWSARMQYNRDESRGASSSCDLLARETWDMSDGSDNEVPPLQSRILPACTPSSPDIDDVPMIIAVTEPPLNFKCPTCNEGFKCPKERKEHQNLKHRTPTNQVKAVGRTSTIGSRLGGRKVKKLVIKPKRISPQTKPEIKSENNFDNLKCKLEDEEVTIKSTLPTYNPEDITSVCTICNKALSGLKSLKQHKLEVHGKSYERHKCNTCTVTFANEYKYTEHLRIHPLECRMCGKYFYRRQNLQLHVKRHLGVKPYKCELCAKSFITKQKHDEHKNVHTGDSPLKCTMCHESFRRHSNLIQHRNRHHLNIKPKIKDYICHCSEVFHSKKKLAWHKEIHDAKPKSCTYCSEKFVHMSSLTRHMRRMHNERYVPKDERANENVECPLCKGVYLRSSLDNHVKSHSGNRPYSCTICNKNFTTKWNLKLHKWTHASRTSKPFKCDQCKGAFIRETDYVAHMNSHKSVRPYTCNYCGAQFIRKSNCQRHVKEHEKKKTYACQICSKTFHRSYYLKDHMRIHSGVRPYACHICGKTSTTKSNHNKHVRIHHAREPVSTEN